MKTWVVAICCVLAGCATTAEPDPWLKAQAMEPLLCDGKEQCDRYWRRAQVWLAENSTYRIQSATDTVISTHGPGQHSPDRAYQVVRVPQSGNVERITIRSGCANMFGCSTNEYERAASFKLYVRGD